MAAPQSKSVHVELHRARFCEWTPAGVSALAATADGSVVAVGRDDGAVELYDVTADWRCAARIPGCEGASLTVLLWCEAAAEAPSPPRLFSAGLGGAVVEWDLAALRPGAATDSTGGPVWHMAARPAEGATPPLLAVACDDGCLRLFDPLPGGGVALARALPRVDARLLSCAWHPDRTTVVVGSSDGCLRCWDSRHGTELLRLTLGSGGPAAPRPCIWAVLALADGTLVSGDSEGRVSIWDGAHGGLRAAFRSHDADVLALAATPGGDAVFAAGADAKLAILQRVPGGAGGAGAWNVTGHKRAHTHDVRALVLAPFPRTPGSMLLSGGADAQLLAYAAENFLGEHPVRVARLPPSLPLALAAGGAQELLLCMHPAMLDVWRLGATAPRQNDAAAANGAVLALAATPRHVARIRVRSQRHLVCSAIASDGSLVAASDAYAPRLFALSGPSVRGCVLDPLLPAAHHLAFTSDAALLVMAAASGAVRLVCTARGSALQVFDAHLSPQRGPRIPAALSLAPVTRLAVSSDRQWLAVAVAGARTGAFTASAACCVCVYSLEAQRLHLHLPSPAEGDASSPVVALAFAPPPSSALLAATAAKELLMVDCEAPVPAWKPTALGTALSDRLRSMPGDLAGLSLDPALGPAAVLLHTQHALCHVDLARPLAADVAAPVKRRRLSTPAPTAAPAGSCNGRVIPLDSPCLFAAYLRSGAALLVERPWQDIQRALPPPLWRARYGGA